MLFAKLLPLSLLLILTGCSSFDREWKAAAEQRQPDISGRWEGRWLSDKNGHTGRLRAVMTQTDSEHYKAHFHATFWKIFHATYMVPLEFEKRNSELFLKGEADLGKLSGGTYVYEAKATPNEFFSTYRSKYDHGTFEMKRPKPAE